MEKGSAHARADEIQPASERSAYHRESNDAYDELKRRSLATSSAQPEVVALSILSLQPGDSPRMNGEDKAHIARLAGTEVPLPPILVDRRTMKIIDGMHRTIVASMQGRVSIDAVFFDGNEADAFLRAVQENVTHGLPLSQSDRKAAAERIISSHPLMSDRAIGESTGLTGKTVAVIRRRASADMPQLNKRMGKDGRVRPLNSDDGRRLAAEVIANRPDASLREVANEAGISVGTVRDVRRRIFNGESPTLDNDAKPSGTRSGREEIGALTPVRSEVAKSAARPGAVVPIADRQPGAGADASAAVQRLFRDPSLRGNEQGKAMLRLLHINAVGVKHLSVAARNVPAHLLPIVVELAHEYAATWHTFAQELDRRVRITDPSRGIRLRARHGVGNEGSDTSLVAGRFLAFSQPGQEEAG